MITARKRYPPLLLWMRGILSAAVISLVFASTAIAAGATEEDGRIAGVVTNASTKMGVEGIEACAQLPELVPIAGGLDRHRSCVETNSSGAYLIEGLPPGEGIPSGGYEVEFKSDLDYIPQFYSGKLERWQATLVPVKSGSTFSGIDAELEVGGRISGRLTNATTKGPIVGARACSGAYGSACATTNANGEYLIEQLSTGKYPVWFTAAEGEVEYVSRYYGNKESPEEAQVSVTAPETTTGINTELEAYGRIAGKVTNLSTKLPIEGVQVCMRERGSCNTTNADGEYTFGRLEAGEYALNFYAYQLNEQDHTNYLSQEAGPDYLTQEDRKAMNPEANHVPVAMGAVTTIDDELEEGGRISGTMTNAATGEPASAWPCAEDLSAPDAELTTICPRSLSGNTYTLSELPPGNYRVVFGDSLPAYYFTQYYNDKPRMSEAQAVPVAAGSNVTGIDADLIANSHAWDGAIAGTVTASSSKAAIDDVEVCAYEKGSEELFGECARTGTSGEYLLSGLPSGEYEVEFSSPSEGDLNYVSQFYNDGSGTDASAVTVVSGSITPAVDAQLHEGGRISGEVTSPSTIATIKDAEVCALAPSDEFEACTVTNATGAYAIPGLPSGDYEVGFNDAKAGYAIQYYDDQSLPSKAQTIAVSTGSSTSGINAQLAEGGRIAGTVTRAATHAAIENVLVCAFTLSAEIDECALTNAGGEYAIAGLSVSEYKVGFNDGKNYAIQYYKDEPSISAAQSVLVSGQVTVSGIDAGMQSGEGGPRPGPPAPPQPPILLPVPAPPVRGGSTIGEAAGGVLGSIEANVGSAQITNLLVHDLEPTPRAARIAALRKADGFTVAFKALEAGTAVIDWYQVPPGESLPRTARAKPILVASGRATFSAAGTARIRVKLTAAGRRLLKHAGSPKLTAKGTFTPTGKSPVIATKPFVLKP